MISEFVSPEEVAMIEHDLLVEADVLEFEKDEWRFYVAGANDMAQKVIMMITRKNHEREELF